MLDHMSGFLLLFLALLVTVDPIGNVPFFVALTEGLSPSEKRRVIGESLVTAFLVGMLFLLVGKGLLALLGVAVSDFKVAGGLLLVVIAVVDIIAGKMPKRDPSEGSVGAVPIGVPLIVGPAVIALLLIQAGDMRAATLARVTAALVANLAIVGLAFANSDRITRLLGRSGTRAISRVVMVILAAYGAMLVRVGIFEAVALAARGAP